MADFKAAYAKVKRFEGGWCNVPGDHGGETFAGIARQFWPDWEGWPLIDQAKKHESFKEGPRAFSAYLLDSEKLPAMAEEWYRLNWWQPLRLGTLSQELADEIFEQAVNMGKGGAGKHLQRLCNALNWWRGGRLFPDLSVDGAIGPKTLQAIRMLLKDRISVREFTNWLNIAQGAFYMGIAAGNVDQRKFFDGWRSRVEVKNGN